MAERKFKFVSPGVFIKEIDKSQLNPISDRRGPLIIGRTERGPAWTPTEIRTFSEFVQIFGNPSPGEGAADDLSRNGGQSAPTYAAYAAQAYLRNNSPITVLRVLGAQHDDADTTSTVATAGWKTASPARDTGGGAYGLFLINSGSESSGVEVPQTGTLAAVWYTANANTRIALKGTLRASTTVTTSSVATLVKSLNTSQEFKADIYTDTSATPAETIVFNFDRDSDKFIRKVFNTTPPLANTNLYSSPQLQNYWLGETFEGSLGDHVTNTGAGGNVFGVTLPLLATASSGPEHNNRNKNYAESKSGWVIGQDLGATGSYTANTAQKLFRVHSRYTGEWDQRNIKISIDKIRMPQNNFEKYGTFSLIVRKSEDIDANVQAIERFDNLSLNPASSNYILRVIGDKYLTWDEDLQILKELGTYNNNSKYIRIEAASDLEAGLDPKYLPVGFFGPLRYKGFTYTSGSLVFKHLHSKGVEPIETSVNVDTLVSGAGPRYLDRGIDQAQIVTDGAVVPTAFTGSFIFPKLQLRVSSSDTTLTRPRDAYFGIDTRRSTNSRVFDASYSDLLIGRPQDVDNHDAGTYTEYQFIFTLDDLTASLATSSAKTVDALWVSGSRASGSSITAAGVSGPNITDVSASLTGLLELGFDKFTMPLYGGFDGFDVTEREPLRNNLLEDATAPTAKTYYTYNTWERGINIAGDVETLDPNIVVAPGLTYDTLTTKLVNKVEERADALAIIDLPGGYVPKYEVNVGSNAESTRLGSVTSTVSKLKARGLNSSYGCAYYPWVLVRDTATTGQTLWVPPSVVALGVMGNSETRSELWFAPAGFNRGGLSNGSAGLPVVGVREKLRAADRDTLYDANINPIATFPSEGIVVFGQKTLQVTPSALDRINVRRLMLFLKKEISNAASRILFDQNVRATWNRFIGEVEPLLASVQARFGLTDYKIVLDETTTTDELVDRNILYAKIFLKPARAIEFIALDFIITNTGASFEE